MSHEVTIRPSGHKFTVEDHESVLTAALREGFSLPYGCRNGACGTCKGTLLEGEVDYGEFQEGTLSIEEMAGGKVLFCVARPKTDLAIEAREIGAAKDIPVRTLPCRIQKMEKVAHDVVVLKLKLPANERLLFLAGQYIDFLLKDGRRRSFSLANPPHDDEFLELHVRHVPGGQFTDHVFGVMKEKDILRFQGPLGSFFLREESDKPMIFVAGGTGFAPIKAVIEHALQAHCAREMVLYWGARTLRDLYLPHLPAKWQAEHANFTFIPVLSEPAAEDRWTGRTGYVHEAVLVDFRDLSGYQVYACGAPAMVKAARTTFIARGLPEGEFFADSFEYQGVPAAA